MARQSYIQDPVTHELIPREEYHARTMGNSSFTVLPDLPDFVSPIDGTVVRGRAGMRDHCARHDVVPTSDLAGLPPKPVVQEYRPDRAAIRELIRRQVYK